MKHQAGYIKSLEEVAEEYLEDLVERNLVIVNSRKSCGKIKSCSLHDMVRDLCIRKTQEEKILDVIDRCVLPRGLKNEERISSIGYCVDNIWGPAIRTVLCFQLQDFPIWLAFSGGFIDCLGNWMMQVIQTKRSLPKCLSCIIYDIFH